MASRSNNVMLIVLATAASAVLHFFGTGLHPLWYLTWFAPLPIFVLATRASTKVTFGTAFLAATIGNLNMWSYDRVLTPLPIGLGLLLVPALLFGVVTLFFRHFALRGHTLRAALSAPALSVAITYLSEFRSPHSTFGNPAYTQMNFLPLLQIVSLTGIWSIGFLLVLLPTSIAAIFTPGASPRGRRNVAILTSAICFLVLGFGIYRLNSDRSSPRVTVGLIASDTVGTLLPTGTRTIVLAEAYASHIPEMTAQGAQVIILPEKIGHIQGADLAAADTIFEKAASENHVTILVSFERQPNLHQARLYSPSGSLEATYEKHHMLPVFESHLLPGTQRMVVDRPSGRWGIQICKDMDFPLLSRQYANDGAGLMLVPAWDFVVDGWLHGRMAILRGVESGFSIARSPKQGLLTLTDDRGRVLAQRSSGSDPFSILVGSVPVRNEPTFYVRTGDWFAWLDLVLLVALFIPVQRKVAPAQCA